MMSSTIKSKDQFTPGGGLRVATDEPHLVSLGGGRLSTAVTIHHLPIGHITIGSSQTCGVILNGSGVQQQHCKVYRNEKGIVTLIPEPTARTLIDGNKITGEVSLTQGTMITIGKSNYLRFNNPAEAQLIKSTMGSNDRISMPQIDFNQDSSSSNEGTPEDVIKNLNDFLESHQNIYKKNNENNLNNLHMIKKIKQNASTIKQQSSTIIDNNINTKNFLQTNLINNKNYDKNNYLCDNNNSVLTKVNNIDNQCMVSATTTTTATATPIPITTVTAIAPVSATITGSPYKMQQSHNQLSQMYDRYPKPGAYGGLQIYPMTCVNAQINSDEYDMKVKHQKAQMDRLQEEEISKLEQERLDEIIKMCAEYDRQNQLIQSSPIVQNRIKTNGSLPRDKKNQYSNNNSMNNSSNDINDKINNLSPTNLYFPLETEFNNQRKVNSGYENVHILKNGKIELNGSQQHQQLQHQQQQQQSPQYTSNGYENVCSIKKTSSMTPQQHLSTSTTTTTNYIPQSPRTKIKTCASPHKKDQQFFDYDNNQHNKKTEYDYLVQTFEEKLKMELKFIRENHSFEHNFNPHEKPMNSIINNDSIAECNNIDKLKTERNDVLVIVRELKTQIAELQRQEDEVLRELDMEKALVNAELSTESTTLIEMEENLTALQNRIYRLEAQRNANRVMQETQQTKLKQTIEMKQDQVERLERLIGENSDDKLLQEELNKTYESLENDKKIFEDLEFHYLEEETEWLAYREELHNDLKILSRHVENKHNHIMTLELQTEDNHNIACTDTKLLENNLLKLLKDLEKNREKLRTIDKKIFEVSGQKELLTDSDDDYDIKNKNNNDVMSQSLFDTNDININTTKLINHHNTNIMSKSLNDNLYFNNNKIEILTTNTSTPNNNYNNKKNIIDISNDITTLTNMEHDKLCAAEELDVNKLINNNNCISNNNNNKKQSMFSRTNSTESDPLLKLKYNFITNDNNNEDIIQSNCNLNLSLESDDFEVNPLDKRMPSQDDIDRISKITLDSPISTQGASYKVKESIKEIERNRQLLLAQQGSHVIEHERQKMNELKRKSHDEARAQYLRIHNRNSQGDDSDSVNSKEAIIEGTPPPSQESTSQPTTPLTKDMPHINPFNGQTKLDENVPFKTPQQRHSHPEFDNNVTQQYQYPQNQQYHQQQQLQQQQKYQRATNGNNVDTKENKKPTSKSTSDIRYSDNLPLGASITMTTVTGSPQVIATATATTTTGTSSSSPTASTNKRHSIISNTQSDISDAGSTNTQSHLVSGYKRNLPKHQRPLTRYLPIMSLDLDLRQHIETAGHQITLCPYVSVDSYSCRGYLHKLGGTFHSWSKRWFVFDRNRGAFIYYSDKSERKPRGGAYFSTIDEVYLDHLNTSKSGRPHSTFIVKTKKRSYHLQAQSDAAARIWIDAIITGAQGNIDY